MLKLKFFLLTSWSLAWHWSFTTLKLYNKQVIKYDLTPYTGPLCSVKTDPWTGPLCSVKTDPCTSPLCSVKTDPCTSPLCSVKTDPCTSPLCSLPHQENSLSLKTQNWQFLQFITRPVGERTFFLIKLIQIFSKQNIKISIRKAFK